MKTLLFLLFLLPVTLSTLAQNLLTNPNKVSHGKKTGFWSEINFCDTIDLEGRHHLVYGPHHTPQSIVAEGLYMEDQKQGYWKEYWIVHEESTSRFKKGHVKSVIEYKNSVPSGLVVEYYPNGSLKAMGQYENFPVNRYDTIKIIDWRQNSKSGRLKDTIIHTTIDYKPTGKWHYFLEDGTLYK